MGTPLSSFPLALPVKPIVQLPLVSTTRRRKLQSCKRGSKRERMILQLLHQPMIFFARGNRGSKKKKKRCTTRLWDLKIPSDLLQEIFSGFGLKENIHASLVCKTWFEAAVSVRKLQPRPWVFYPLRDYILFDPLRSQTYKQNFPELKNYILFCSRYGWLLVVPYHYPSTLAFFLNPFTRERIYLPKCQGSCYLSIFFAFSAAPTSTSCLVISVVQLSSIDVVDTWRPGETVWTTHSFENQLPGYRRWTKFVFSNGMFYCLSTCGHLGVFDPSRETWNILLQVEPCPAFPNLDFMRPVLMMEHEGDIFLMYTRDNNNPAVFKLNLKRNAWEPKRDLGGLTVFASYPGSFARAGLSAEERNRIYTPYIGLNGMYYSLGLGDEKSSRFPPSTALSPCIAWMDPPSQQH